MHVFDESLQLKEGGDGRLHGELDNRWWIYIGPNGGFLSSLCLRALQHVVGDELQPRTLSVHFPGRAAEGPVEFEVQLDRKGRTFTFASGRMFQRGKLMSTFLATFAPAGESMTFDDAPMPDAKMPEDIPEIVMPDEMIPEFSRNFDYRSASDFMPFSGADRAQGMAWIRFKDERPLDALQVPTIADGLYPAIFAKLSAPAAVPTIDLTVHFRATLPRPYDWLLGRFETKRVTEGFFEEDGEMWARDGTLIAQSRQLALLREFG
ncbi:MAG: thioesterase family protein [Actinomycetota bacterium]|nr:thioesterase family protein [Actinomycetota bacterium]